jgi:alkylated DNA repair protein (DNA oxidative demethylase)
MPPRLLVDAPPGLTYWPEFVAPAEESALVAEIERLDFSEIRMHGVAARRRAVHFGWVYGYESWKLTAGSPIPEFLLPLRSRAAALVSLEPEAFAEALVTEYPPGAVIGWHRDAPMFGPVVIGVSLVGSCRLRLRREADTPPERFTLTLEPRSAYVLSGPARTEWQHSIPPTPGLRYSITFRILRQRKV